MPALRRTAVLHPALLTLALAIAGCGADTPSPPAEAGVESPAAASAASPAAEAGATAIDLSAIACATDDPTDVGELTGAWKGSEGGVYYIRQVGDCVWWFGTELKAIETGVTDQFGFANVAAGRVNGTHIEVEFADLPMGNVIGGGGLTLAYDGESEQLTVTEQRGDWIPFGARTFTRVKAPASPGASPGASAVP